MKRFNSHKTIYPESRFSSVVGFAFCVYMLFFSAPCAYAQESWLERTSLFVSVANGDVYRGLNRHDHSIALQSGLRVSLSEQFSVGLQLHQAQYPSATNAAADEVEFNYYLAWSRSLSESMGVQVRFSRYTYPGSFDGFFEYDYNELMLALDVSPQLNVSVSFRDTGVHFHDGILYTEISWKKHLLERIEFSAALGGARALNFDLPDFGYWDVGLSRPVASVVVDLRYHHASRDTRWLGRQPADGQWVLSLTWGW